VGCLCCDFFLLFFFFFLKKKKKKKKFIYLIKKKKKKKKKKKERKKETGSSPLHHTYWPRALTLGIQPPTPPLLPRRAYLGIAIAAKDELARRSLSSMLPSSMP
jgi:hypothetical protein